MDNNEQSDITYVWDTFYKFQSELKKHFDLNPVDRVKIAVNLTHTQILSELHFDIRALELPTEKLSEFLSLGDA